MSKKVTVGGQAVIEGVMMRGSKGIATAVRKSNGEIEVDFNESVPLTKKYKVFSFPIIRGFITLIDSLIIGVKSLNYSASFFMDEEEDEDEGNNSKPSKLDEWIEKVFKDKADDIVMGLSLIFSMIISLVLFFIIPTFLANGFKRIGAENTVVLNVFEGIIRVCIFLLYIYLISKLEDIKRVFQYHGAEHKTIFCYEKGIELTPDNAKEQGRLHPRCGTNFMFLVMTVSILLFSFTGWNSIYERILSRVVLLPIVSGVTYELIRWLGKNDSGFAKIIAYPGLMLQKLTTKEPDLEQIEVAIYSLKVAEGIETVESIKNKNEIEKAEISLEAAES